MYQIGNTSILQETIFKNAKQLAEFSYSVDNLGLYNGKVGILLALHSVAKNLNETNCLIIDEAIRQLQEDISEKAGSADDSYQDGIFGIGWAISTLYEQGIIPENEAEVMNSFDDELYKLVMYRKCDAHDLENGTMGRINYYLRRINEHLKQSNKYRYVCNYECLMLLVDDFTNENENIIAQVESGGISLLSENGKYYTNMFNLLSRLVQKNIHPEVTEKQQLQLLRSFVQYFDCIAENPIPFLEYKTKYWSTVAILNCLLQVGEESEAVAKRLNSGRHLIQEIIDWKMYALRDAQQLMPVISCCYNNNRILAEDDTTDILVKMNSENRNYGLNGFAGFLFLANDYKNNIKIMRDAFLVC